MLPKAQFYTPRCHHQQRGVDFRITPQILKNRNHFQARLFGPAEWFKGKTGNTKTRWNVPLGFVTLSASSLLPSSALRDL